MSVGERILSLELIELNKKNPVFFKEVGVTATIVDKKMDTDLKEESDKPLEAESKKCRSLKKED